MRKDGNWETGKTVREGSLERRETGRKGSWERWELGRRATQGIVGTDFIMHVLGVSLR